MGFIFLPQIQTLLGFYLGLKTLLKRIKQKSKGKKKETIGQFAPEMQELKSFLHLITATRLHSAVENVRGQRNCIISQSTLNKRHKVLHGVTCCSLKPRKETIGQFAPEMQELKSFLHLITATRLYSAVENVRGQRNCIISQSSLNKRHKVLHGVTCCSLKPRNFF